MSRILVRTCLLALAPVAPFLAACDCPQRSAAAPGNGNVYAELAFPTGDRATSAILVRQSGPREVRLGKECNYTIEVQNLTRHDLQNVVVNLDDISNVQFVSSEPPPVNGHNGDMQWVLSDLPACGTKTIAIRAKPLAVGTASNCLSASYANVLCSSSTVVAPSLDLTKQATPEVCGQCDEITLTYRVRNPGSGVAESVRVRDALPSGMTTADGRTEVVLDAGDLDAGQERTFTVKAKATKQGSFASSASASSDSGLMARSDDPETVVRQPQLAFSCDANNRVFLGRDLAYRVTVRNVGQCDASGAVVRAAVPAGSKFISADGGGRIDGGNVVWDLDRLPAGKASTFTMKVRPAGVGTATVAASAAANCVPTATTECATEVVGIPAILLEVVDTVDPVEVGSETTFNVVVTNQGSTADGDVKVIGVLPPSLQFVSGSGATAVSGSGQTVTLAPLGSLAPGARAEWRIVVKAKSVADARSRWEMTSDHFKTPVIETESSNLYE